MSSTLNQTKTYYLWVFVQRIKLDLIHWNGLTQVQYWIIRPVSFVSTTVELHGIKSSDTILSMFNFPFHLGVTTHFVVQGNVSFPSKKFPVSWTMAERPLFLGGFSILSKLYFHFDIEFKLHFDFDFELAPFLFSFLLSCRDVFFSSGWVWRPPGDPFY